MEVYHSEIKMISVFKPPICTDYSSLTNLFIYREIRIIVHGFQVSVYNIKRKVKITID